MRLKNIKRLIVLQIVNHLLAGTKFFDLKRSLLRSIGYVIGENTKIVGPVTNTGKLQIGDNCWIGRNLTIHGNGTVIIGDNCDIAPDVMFLTGGHQIGTSERRAGAGESYDIVVGNGVWIGARATIQLQTTIEDGSVVTSCACVTKDVPANTVVGGVPAKLIKKLEEDTSKYY